MSKRAKKVMDGWPHAHANIEFEPLILPPEWGGFSHSEWAQKTEDIRQAAVIARDLCKMDRPTLRRRIGELVAADGGSADGAFIAMLHLLRDSIERVKALDALLKAAEARSYGAYTAVEAGMVEEPA